MPATQCPQKPKAPAIDASDNEWAIYKKSRDNRGDDCGDKLGAVDSVVKAWPQ